MMKIFYIVFFQVYLCICLKKKKDIEFVENYNIDQLADDFDKENDKKIEQNIEFNNSSNLLIKNKDYQQNDFQLLSEIQSENNLKNQKTKQEKLLQEKEEDEQRKKIAEQKVKKFLNNFDIQISQHKQNSQQSSQSSEKIDLKEQQVDNLIEDKKIDQIQNDYQKNEVNIKVVTKINDQNDFKYNKNDINNSVYQDNNSNDKNIKSEEMKQNLDKNNKTSLFNDTNIIKKQEHIQIKDKIKNQPVFLGGLIPLSENQKSITFMPVNIGTKTNESLNHQNFLDLPFAKKLRQQNKLDIKQDDAQNSSEINLKYQPGYYGETRITFKQKRK